MRKRAVSSPLLTHNVCIRLGGRFRLIVPTVTNKDCEVHASGLGGARIRHLFVRPDLSTFVSHIPTYPARDVSFSLHRVVGRWDR